MRRKVARMRCRRMMFPTNISEKDQRNLGLERVLEPHRAEFVS